MYCRRLLTIALLLGLSLALAAGPANAWEFSMSGVFTWLYEVRGQNGVNGFFGAYDHAQVSGVPITNVTYTSFPPPYLTPLTVGTTTVTSLNRIGIAAPLQFLRWGLPQCECQFCGTLEYQPSVYGWNGKP